MTDLVKTSRKAINEAFCNLQDASFCLLNVRVSNGKIALLFDILLYGGAFVL